ncbi:phosphogluconate dehydratase [Formosimonas limnophila]|uniref:Phosphogluconate dehydratase n=1 Tax=Formosimonas limnophila TaxID=1384487 RepID=A0A8J3CHU8_9BURK|nr:phosphogluconate dehydratase [Formosimonas limnophila]GHA73585.1 phosphogluconate dehydratase [Formosimonas limnophila]
MPQLHPTIVKITERLIERSRASRARYFARINASGKLKPSRDHMGCANLAHAYAAAGQDQFRLRVERQPNIGIITSFNDMLSAHQPYEHYPPRLKAKARSLGATAQVAGATAAMCDGVTQGYAGMELSLFSRDAIAQSTVIGLSHQVFDAALLLGVCDKIVPGLLMGAAAFGHLPALFVPAGPMTTGISNKDKARVRQRFATGDATREELLDSELKAYHSEGTCTFYGTANSNQMMLEFMGLMLPGSAFVNPSTELRAALDEEAVTQALSIANHPEYSIAQLLNEKSIINGVIGLLATGGSTNHTLHIVAIARAAGIELRWEDMDELGQIIPLLARVYPNGSADVNQFHAAGGLGYVIGQLRSQGLLHDDVDTVVSNRFGKGMAAYTQEPYFHNGQLAWRAGTPHSLDESIVRPIDNPFAPDGGLKLLQGNLGRAVIKTSAVGENHRVIRAPAMVFEDQSELQHAFKEGKLDCKDFVAVVRFQGPKALGMPELHKLTPPLGVLQDRGQHVALVTDGRMSGASGKVPAAIHVSPEALDGGLIAKIQNGDIITVDANTGVLQLEVSTEELTVRTPAQRPDMDTENWLDFFAVARANVGRAELGATWLIKDVEI